MPSRFDENSGTLTMTIGAIAALPSLVASDFDRVQPEVLEELAQGGLLVDEALHPRLTRAAQCVASPHVRLQLDRGRRGRFHLDGWVRDNLAVLARTDDFASSAAFDVVVVPRGMVAFTLARLIELGPRPRLKVTDPLEIDEGLFEAMVGAGERLDPSQIQALLSNADEVIPEWLHVLSDVSAADPVRWRAGAWWNSEEESPTARMLEVGESSAGSFLVTHRRRSDRIYRRVELHPLTATHIWRLLCALLPRPEVITEPLDR